MRKSENYKNRRKLLQKKATRKIYSKAIVQLNNTNLRRNTLKT